MLDPERIEFELRCRNDFAFFCENVLNLEIAKFHKELLTLPIGNRYLCVIIPRGHSKCISEGSRVLLSDGSYVPIEEIPCYESGDIKDRQVISLSTRTFTNVGTYAKRIYQGHKPVYKVTTTSGRVLNCTDTHKFFNGREWIELSKLAAGCFIATPRVLPIFGNEDISDAEIKFIAYMLGDGSCSSHVSFCNSDEEVVSDFKDACDRINFKTVKHGINYGVSNKGKALHSCGPIITLKKYGLFGKNSYGKFVPNPIFRVSKQKVALFLNRLYTCDGAIGTGKSRCVTYGSVSYRLIQDIQHLLLRFGFLARIYKSNTTYKGKPYSSYNLVIWGEQECLRFVRDIGIFTKDHKIKGFGKCSNTNCDVIPSDLVYHGLRGNTKKLRAAGLRDISTYKKYNPSRGKALLIGQLFDNKEVVTLASSDIFWDKIKSIEYVGLKHVYDLVVEEQHNFVAENFYVHNTSLYSIAYPLWRLWREKNIEYCLVSSSLDQSMKIFSKAQEILETNPFFSSLLPQNRFNSWNKSELLTKNGNRFFIKTFNDSARGMHPHYITYDDLLREGDLDMAKIREVFWSVFAPCGDYHNCQHIVVGTPFSIDDLYTDFDKPENKNWKKVTMRAIITDELGNWVRPLWDERYSLEYFRQQLNSMNENLFMREYMCSPQATGDTLFPKEMILNSLDYDMEYGFKTEGVTTIGADFAMSTQASGDYNVFTVVDNCAGTTYIKKTDKGDVEVKDPVFVRRIIRYRGNVGHIENLRNLHAYFPMSRIIADSSHVGAKFVMELREQSMWVDGQDFQPAHRNMMLMNLRRLLEQNRLVIPSKGESSPLTDRLIKELSSFRKKSLPSGGETWKSYADHDDMVMSMALACRDIGSPRKMMMRMFFSNSGQKSQDSGFEFK